MEKKQKLEKWAVLRKGCYRPVFTTFKKEEAERFVQGHEHMMSVCKVIG